MPDKMFLSNFEPDEFVPLIGFGIVNPFGPTFMGYGFKRSLNDKIELIFFSLNPFDVFIDKLHSFNQTFLDAQIEAVILGSEAPNIIQNFLSRKVSEKQAFGTPSFMCVNIDLWREDLREVIQGIIFDTIKFSSEPHSTLTDLKAFPLNVMDRVSYEMRKSLDPGNLVQATDEEIIELIGIIIDYEHVDQELKGFFIAWDGAINHQAEQGSGQLASDAIDLESFIDILILMFPDLFAEQNDNLDTAEYSGLKCPICNEHLGCSHHVASVNRNAGECEDGIWLDEENKFVSMIESSFLANLKNGRGLASDNKELQLLWEQTQLKFVPGNDYIEYDSFYVYVFLDGLFKRFGCHREEEFFDNVPGYSYSLLSYFAEDPRQVVKDCFVELERLLNPEKI